MLPLSRRIRLACVLLIAACGGGSTPPVDNTPASITLSPATTVALQSGATATLSASVAAADHHVITGALVSWSTADASVAAVSAGLVTAIKTGTTTITASSGSATALVAVTVTPGAASQLAIRTQPVGAVVGSPLATQPVIELRDAVGNVVTSSIATVTASLITGSGTLGGTTSVVAVAGVATFSNVSVSGTPGTNTLAFASNGLPSVTSASFSMTPPPTPLIALDASSVAFSTQFGTSPAAKTVTITNGGAAAFGAVTADPVAYDAGQATGWLTVALSGSAPPFTLTLTPSTATLAPGTYHATVRINAAGAANTPASISVTLTVSAVTVTYGGATERVRLLNVGASFAPTLTGTANGQVAPLTGVSFTSRATSVATVDATGRITAVAAGQSWIVATGPGGVSSDSVFVTVARSSTGPLLVADLTTYNKTVGDVTTVTFTLTPQTTTIGAATLVVGYDAAAGTFGSVSASTPVQTPQPVIGLNTLGVFKISVAAAAGISTPVIVLRLTFTARNSGSSGWLTFGVLEATDTAGADISAQFTTTRYPIVVR